MKRVNVDGNLRGLLDDAEAEREKLRAELVQLAQLVDRGDRGAGSLARATRRAHDPTYTDQEAKF